MRGVALAAAMVTSLGIAGCASGDTEQSAATQTTEAEVFSWWTEGSEKAGLDALVAVFNKQHPNVQFVNATVAGGAGSNATQVLAERLSEYDPPDSFQSHAGAAVVDYVKRGQIEDLSSLYDEWGLRDVFPADLISQLTVRDKIYSIPANIHRANMVWINPDVLKTAGLDPKATYSTTADWIKALEAIKKTGKTPLALGQSWTQVQLLETTLLADLGVKGYNGLWDGTTNWGGSQVRASLQNFQKLLELSNSNRDELEWPQALALLKDGKAGFNVMGDWAAAELENDGAKLGSDVLYSPVPGTAGVFDYLADSFTLPVGAPHPEGSKAWLETVGSLDGQVAFNKAKGSIPARTDADPSEFSEYQQGAIKDFKDNTIVSSLAHGAAAAPTELDAITAAVADFATQKTDLAAFQKALVAAAKG
ncbi:extracellular solute-binding protein [Rarobacter incanus]